MWFEHLVELKRRTGPPPPPLPEKQEAFVRGFSFYNDIRPPHYLAKFRTLGLPGTFTYAAMLPLFTYMGLWAWLGRPVSEAVPYAKWLGIGFLVLIPLVWIFVYSWKGRRIRRRRWEFWEWPDFASFAMEEANAQMWGTINFAATFVMLLLFAGWVAR